MSVRAILLCGPGGGILMERIYSPELVHGAPEGRALWRQAIAGAASDLANALAEDEEAIVMVEGDAVVVTRTGELTLYAVGSGAYSELAIAEVARAAASAVKSVCKKTPTEQIVLDKYTKTCFYVDECVGESGLADALDAQAMRRGAKFATAKEVV